MAKELLPGNYPLTVGNKNDVTSVRLGFGRFRVDWEQCDMRVPDVVSKCVGFVGEVAHQDSSGVDGDLYGTGFFVSMPSDRIPGHNFICFVTAKHVATDLKGRMVYFLVNKKGGGVTTLRSHGPSWWTHPSDDTADVAIIPISPQPDVEFVSVSVNDLLTPDLIQQENIGIGDEVFATGLFSPAIGSKGNMPILRHGNIAMLPDEQIQTELGFADVYLIEARSIGGLSGSPVFVRPTVSVEAKKKSDGSPILMYGVSNRLLLLGLMHGHWDIKESTINNAKILHTDQRGVNLGVGIVVPAIKILETINRKELEDMRREFEEEIIRKNTPRMDSARKSSRKAEFTQGQFEAALKKASRRIHPSESAAKKK